MEVNKMKICNQCGNEVSDYAAYCPWCGAPLKEQTEKKAHPVGDFISRHRTHIIIAFVMASILTFLIYKGPELINNGSLFKKEYFTGNVIEVSKTLDVTIGYQDGTERHFTLPMRYADFVDELGADYVEIPDEYMKLDPAHKGMIYFPNNMTVTVLNNTEKTGNIYDDEMLVTGIDIFDYDKVYKKFICLNTDLMQPLKSLMNSKTMGDMTYASASREYLSWDTTYGDIVVSEYEECGNTRGIQIDHCPYVSQY